MNQLVNERNLNVSSVKGGARRETVLSLQYHGQCFLLLCIILSLFLIFRLSISTQLSHTEF